VGLGRSVAGRAGLREQQVQNPVGEDPEHDDLDHPLYNFYQLTFRQGPLEPLKNLSVPEEEQQRNAAQIETGGHHPMVVHVEPADRKAAPVTAGQPVDDGGHLGAVAAGCGIEKGKHWNARGLNESVEGARVQLDRRSTTLKVERSSAPAALGTKMLFIGRDTVFLTAGAARDNDSIHGQDDYS